MGHYYSEEQYNLATPVVLQYIDLSLPNHPAVRDGERLIGRLDNGLRRIYPDLTRKAEFEEFYTNYARGFWLSFDVRVITMVE